MTCITNDRRVFLSFAYLVRCSVRPAVFLRPLRLAARQARAFYLVRCSVLPEVFLRPPRLAARSALRTVSCIFSGFFSGL